jgi:acetyltransferase-like isoleucine patch superfamily enzyme
LLSNAFIRTEVVILARWILKAARAEVTFFTIKAIATFRTRVRSLFAKTLVFVSCACFTRQVVWVITSGTVFIQDRSFVHPYCTVATTNRFYPRNRFLTCGAVYRGRSKVKLEVFQIIAILQAPTQAIWSIWMK